MKLIHLSDLHLGKRVNEFSMIEDQKYILTRIVNIIDDEKPDGVIIAGDVYDRSIPSEEAVALFDDFLTRLAKRKLQVFVISGNHDSAGRLSFASGLLDFSGVHISPAFHGKIEPFVIETEKEKVNLYLLPFIKPAVVRNIFPNEVIESYTDAVRVAIEHMELSPLEINILAVHQFVTGAERSESEEISVGSMDNVDAAVFDVFDYVALGHIHGPQQIGKETIRYCGTPLKYSFSEVKHQKSVTVVEIHGKDAIGVRTVPLVPLHDMREIKGTYEELTNKKNYENTETEDYLSAVLTDENDIPDAMAKLRMIYPNLMKLGYDNKRTRENRQFTDPVDVDSKSPLTLFEEFYELLNNQPMSEVQRRFSQELIEKIWEDKA